MNTNKVGTLTFDKRQLDVYSSLDEPLFSARDVADMVGYSAGNTWNMLGMVETDEKLILPMVVAGQSRSVSFVTESGLYNILAQSRKPHARKWRRLISDELINLRKQRNYNVLEQFQEWDHKLDDIFFDEGTGMMMQSVTLPGGDVDQIPYRGGEISL